MSSMLPQPPRQIQIGGGDPGAGPGGPPGAGDPDAQDVVGKLRQAFQLLQDAAAAEKDDIDASAITKIAAQVHAQIAAEQKLTDDVMGAGPGVKMVRKTAGGGGAPSGPGY